MCMLYKEEGVSNKEPVKRTLNESQNGVFLALSLSLLAARSSLLTVTVACACVRACMRKVTRLVDAICGH